MAYLLDALRKIGATDAAAAQIHTLAVIIMWAPALPASQFRRPDAGVRW